MTESQLDQRSIPEAIAGESTRDLLAKVRSRARANLARTLKVSMETVSRIEKRTDLYLSTLRSYVEGVGGELTLMVKFPDQPPVILTGLGEGAEEVKKKHKTRAKSKAGTCRAA